MEECDFCSDMRNIEPAKYISAANGEDPEWLVDAKKKHQFIYHYWDDGNQYFAVVDKCPVCGHIFTEEDYGSYF